MGFSSVTFLFIFLPVFLLFYYVLPKRAENYVLVIGSIMFYAWGEPVFIALLLYLAMVCFVLGLLIDRFSASKPIRVTLMIAGVFFCFTLFVFGKFIPAIGSFIEKFSDMSTFFVGIPLGIAFYVLSCVSYIVDICLQRSPAQKKFMNYMVYVCMFPKIALGPIVPYHTMERQLDNRTVTSDKIYSGIILIIKGLGKTVLISGNLLLLCDSILENEPSQISVGAAWLGVTAALLGYFFEFYGYTDIARGLGKMLGFQLPKNFHFPFMARTVTDFFKRWHTSLGRWIRIYIYNPANKYLKNIPEKLRRVIILLTIVVFVTLWHDITNGILLAAVFYLMVLLGEYFIWGRFLKKIPSIFGRIYTLFITLLAFAILINNNFSQAWDYLLAMFGLQGQSLFDDLSKYYLFSYLPLLIISFIVTSRLIRVRLNRLKRFYPKLFGWATTVGCFAVFVLSTAFILNA